MNLKTISLPLALLAVSALSADTKAPAPAKPSDKTAAKPISKEKVEAIKKLFVATNLIPNNVDGAKEAIKAMKKNSPNINPKFWEDLDKSANAAVYEELLGTVYDRYYSLDEIKALTKFFQTPAGKAFMEKNAKVQGESGHILQIYMDGQSKDLMKKYGAPAPSAAPKKN